MKAIIWKDNTVTYKNVDGEIVTKELKKFDGNKGFIFDEEYFKYIK